MIEQEEGSSRTTSPDEPEIVIVSPMRPEEAKEVLARSERSDEHEHEGAGKSSRQPESHHTCIIDIKSTGESMDDANSSNEKVCRICHLSSDESVSSELVNLGCRCKGELGMSHRDCAEIWFMHRGNRQCEICGQTATNVRGNRSSVFMIQRNERRMVASSSVSAVSLDNEVPLSCCWGQRFCNFLLTCTVLAFLLPWFFRFNFF
ncbi:hypothetical protein SDJN02_16677 [Cucurbita argyrosperma subsp. argyrosperma]|nr:hypothetical protein SDJN02_16677 [Cucurbita argyrosperma subsp. argyrosperma]